MSKHVTLTTNTSNSEWLRSLDGQNAEVVKSYGDDVYLVQLLNGDKTTLYRNEIIPITQVA